MNTSLTVLVWIISIMLGIFLALAIATLVLALKIMRDLRRIAKKAEHLADSAQAVGEFFRKSAGPASLARLVVNVVEGVRGKSKRKEEE